MGRLEMSPLHAVLGSKLPGLVFHTVYVLLRQPLTRTQDRDRLDAGNRLESLHGG
jgi:hypothetical protein